MSLSGQGGKLQLNNEQLQALFNKLSSDEQKELQDLMRNCTTDVTVTRGIPITAAVVGSLYFARSRLPKQYHFGPKGWPFYAILGIGSLTASNILFMGTCRDRIQPKVIQLWNKYQLGTSHTSYDALRRQNREISTQPVQSFNPSLQSQPPMSNDTERTQLDTSNYDPYGPPPNTAYSFDFTEQSKDDKVPKHRPVPYPYQAEEAFMSGTPNSSTRNDRKFS